MADKTDLDRIQASYTSGSQSYEPSTEGTQAAQPVCRDCKGTGVWGQTSPRGIGGQMITECRTCQGTGKAPAPVAQVDARTEEVDDNVEYKLSPEDVEFNRVMKLYCGDDFNMQAGFQRAWLYLHVHGISRPAVAQVDAGKCYLCGTSPICEDGRCFACRLEERTQADVIAAVVQTELPPIPEVPNELQLVGLDIASLVGDNCRLRERIASLTQRLQEQEAEVDRVREEFAAWTKGSSDRMEALERSLRRISDWCEAYPLKVFPEPDLEADRKLLGDSEFTRLNAHSMRHVVEGIARIAAAEKL